MRAGASGSAASLRETLASALFSGGWAFFLPYAGLYALGLAFDVRVGTLRGGFWLCHLSLAALVVSHAFRTLRRRCPTARDLLADVGLWFWALMFLAFLLPGVYLEYPSDTWDHFSRLNSWRPETPLGISLSRWRGAYFFDWSFLSFVEPVRQRAALALLAAFWQILVAFQMARLARRLGFSSNWSKVVVFGAVALFGNNLFSFFRYYALASTPLAYVAYLRAAIAVLDLYEARGRAWRSWLVLAATTGLVAFNHVQELLLIAVFAASQGFAWRFRPEGDRFRSLAGAALCLLGALAVGWFVLSHAAALGLPPPVSMYPFMSRFGSFRIWDPKLSYFHTLGLHGLLSLALALLLWRRERSLAAVTLAPTFLLLLPAFAYPLAQVTSLHNTYRVLYVLPDSFMLAAGARAIPARWLRAWAAEGQERARLLVGIAFFTGVGLLPWSPFFGKLPFQYHVPSPLLSLAPLDVTAQWFRAHRRLADECSVTSDSATETVLASFRGTGGPVLRTSGLRWLNGGRVAEWTVVGPDDLLDYRLEHRVCGFLAFDPEVFRTTFPDWPLSWVGARSGHWSPDHANLATRQVVGLRAAAEGLAQRGWRKTFVPPFYWYYEAPDSLP